MNVLTDPSSGRYANRQTSVSYVTFAQRTCSVNASKKQSWAAEKWGSFKLTILRGVNTLGNVAQGNTYWDKSVYGGVEWPCARPFEYCVRRAIYSLFDRLSSSSRIAQNGYLANNTNSKINTLELNRKHPIV